MVFNSFHFVYFFTIVFLLYWISSNRYKWVVLLIASYFMFGCFNLNYVVLLLFSTFIDYILAKTLISKTHTKQKKIGLLLSILTNLGLLICFKYLDFIIEQINLISSSFNIELNLQYFNLMLPVGISFYTFQTMSYSIDVYKGEIQAEKNFGKFALYVSFFPQLISGPIERAKDLLPQFNENRILNFENIKKGLLYILVGYFFKIVVADQVGTVVDSVFNNLYQKNGTEIIYAMYHFSIQIYADFAGYSFIALGIAQFFAIDLMVNFKSPYLSQSFTDFWRRWHISLSLWTRDYIYIKLGGNSKGYWIKTLNIILVFFVIGIWHGSSYNFLLWGLLHAFVLITEKTLRFEKDSKNILRWIRIIFVFTICTLIWIPFRSKDLEETLFIFNKIKSVDFYQFYLLAFDNRFTPPSLAIFILITFELYLNKKQIETIFNSSLILQYLIYTILFFSIILLGYSEGAQFIYFQF